jgi:hypothetical protein
MAEKQQIEKRRDTAFSDDPGAQGTRKTPQTSDQHF